MRAVHLKTGDQARYVIEGLGGRSDLEEWTVHLRPVLPTSTTVQSIPARPTPLYTTIHHRLNSFNFVESQDVRLYDVCDKVKT